MSYFILLLKFFGEIFLIFVLGYVIGRLLKLDKFIKNRNNKL